MPLTEDASETTPVSARWTTRIALFSAALVLSALFLHRLFSIPTPVALNLVKLSILGGFISLALAFIASVRIWRVGAAGGARVFVGVLIALAVIGWPLPQLATIRDKPEINDLTTDTKSPPPFKKLAAARARDANNPKYPGAAFAEAQMRAYPDLRPLQINRSVAEAYEISADALRRQRLSLVNEEPPGEDFPATGLIEAYDRTPIWGFYDDVAIRVTGNSQTAQIDVRSASRYGAHDLGRNTERIRRILKEIVVRLEATVPTAEGDTPRRSSARRER
ncbi:conserved membrane protein of unknown function [Candidatus Filomicrobium marinum]|uniref:DUF1499 domain-containing protein n=1 Tax=Candidatus Filomicrobium marinum TaxID=1608628 RepID=A0A0D6JGU8_9HYPH|nr:DUF1499 domain-containing protein [Candidatus Filomicrobium marinum]CFX29596.1 conserved membrane protein of unknown function [Candidatus Filomicrobium marinum]CPR19846.1 conserved membrane protein of unknown function [Candidatus Filomicrobium marinum]